MGDIIRYRTAKTQDGEGGFIESLISPMGIYPNIVYNDVSISISIRIEEDIKVGDIVRIDATDYYRVIEQRKFRAIQRKTLVLEKVEHPVWDID